MIFEQKPRGTRMSDAVRALALALHPHGDNVEAVNKALADFSAARAKLDLEHSTDATEALLTRRVVPDWMQATLAAGALAVGASWDVAAPSGPGMSSAFLGGVKEAALAEALACAEAIAEAGQAHEDKLSAITYFKHRRRPTRQALGYFRYDHARKVSAAIEAAGAQRGEPARQRGRRKTVADVKLDDVAPIVTAAQAAETA